MDSKTQVLPEFFASLHGRFPNSGTRLFAKTILALVCACLENGVSPLHPEKLEGPSYCMTVLGIELDLLALWAPLS